MDTPTILNARLPLLGVKMTLNRVVVKLEAAWQEFRDFDSRYRSADATFDKLEINVRRSHSGLEEGERRIVGCVVGKI